MRVVFMGKSKRSAVLALDWLAARGAEVVAVVAPDPDDLTHERQRLDLAASRHGMPLTTEEELYASPPANVDVVVSFLFWNRIREPLISLGRAGCLNFHPAPLPDYRGVGGYNVAILEGLASWGVSCHFVDEHLDTGDLVEVERFPIDPVRDGAPLPRSPQQDGRYVSRAEFEELRVVRPGDDLRRKLRAFWYPPWPGAVLDVDGQRLTLVDESLLADVAAAYRDSGRLP